MFIYKVQETRHRVFIMLIILALMFLLGGWTASNYVEIDGQLLQVFLYRTDYENLVLTEIRGEEVFYSVAGNDYTNLHGPLTSIKNIIIYEYGGSKFYANWNQANKFYFAPQAMQQSLVILDYFGKEHELKLSRVNGETELTMPELHDLKMNAQVVGINTEYTIDRIVFEHTRGFFIVYAILSMPFEIYESVVGDLGPAALIDFIDYESEINRQAKESDESEVIKFRIMFNLVELAEGRIHNQVYLGFIDDGGTVDANNGGMLLIISIVFVVILISGALYYFVTKKKNHIGADEQV